MVRCNRFAVWSLLAVLFCCSSYADGEEQVRSQIISAVPDGAGGYKIVNGAARHAILRANFTNLINTTGYVVKNRVVPNKAEFTYIV